MPDECTTTEQTDRPFLTATELADRLGLSDKTIRKRIANGEIQACKHGRVWQIPISEVERIAEQSADPPEAPTDRNGTEELTGLNGNLTGTSADPNPVEVERLRGDLETMTERALSAEKRLERALDSIQSLSEQNERLTILLANEQVQRLKALPNPLGWISRLFGQKFHT